MKGSENMKESYQPMIDSFMTLLQNKTKLNLSLDISSADHKDTISICVKDNPYHDDHLFLAEIDYDAEVIRLLKVYHSSFLKTFTLLGVLDYLTVLEKWEDDTYTNFPFENFAELIEKQSNALSSAFSQIIKYTVSFGYGKQIMEKIIPLIKQKYTQNACMDIVRKTGSENSIVIRLGNNPWRNGLIKGDIIFCIIKADGTEPYILFKNKYSKYFDDLGIVYTSNTTEKSMDMIRMSLYDFKKELDNPTEKFIQFINEIYISNIAFPQFGCCSKHMECTKAGKCLHIDPLYATACQYQKMMKRSGKFENS